MRKLLRRCLIFCSIAVVAALVLVFFGRMIDPSGTPLLGLFLMGYPIILVINILLLVFWALRKNQWAWIHLIVLTLTWSLHSGFIQPWPQSNESGHIRLMTFNTQLFGFYQFKQNKELRSKNLAMLDSLDTDIFCFQEFYKTDNPKGFQTISLIQEQMGPLDVHEKYTHEFVHKQYFGVVTLSRFPIVFRGYIPFEADINNFCIYSDILLPSKDTIRVFNAHLASIHFRPDDYAFTRGEFEGLGEFGSGFEQVRFKLEAAEKRRTVQIDRILEEVVTSPYPVVFAGDLNTTPFSNAYYKTTRLLNDAFQSGGIGISASYKSRVPVLRIDHIFHDDRVVVKRYDRVKAGVSDHYPVIIDFDIADK